MFTLAEAQDDPGRRLIADLRVVSAEYFTTMAIPVVEGEACRRQSADGPAEFMVNRSFAARYLSDRPSVLGLHLITAASRSTPGRIVGVVADARERGLDRLPGPTVYPCQSAPNPTPLFLLRTRADPSDLAAQVRLAVRQQDPLRSVYDMLPLERRIDDAFAQNRIRTGLLAFFAGTALTLACVGLYGTMSYAVSLRRREMGLRLALGATRSGVVRQLVLGALRGVTAATGLGVILSLGFTRLLSGLLFGVSPSDPFVLTSVVLLVFGVATLAALLPALRASRVTPVIALRDV
jgi:putative ABC transport system permease protein